MKTNHDYLMDFIEKWIELNEELRELNKYIYEHTELFEEKHMDDYREELYSFFAGKSGRFTKDINQLYQLLNREEIEEISKIKLLKRRFR